MAGQHASTPAIPAPTREQQRLQAENTTRRQAAELLERKRQIRGLLWLLAAVLVLSILRAGLSRVFGPQWWRLW